jgi:hypothetical protein
VFTFDIEGAGGIVYRRQNQINLKPEEILTCPAAGRTQSFCLPQRKKKMSFRRELRNIQVRVYYIYRKKLRKGRFRKHCDENSK